MTGLSEITHSLAIWLKKEAVQDFLHHTFGLVAQYLRCAASNGEIGIGGECKQRCIDLALAQQKKTKDKSFLQEDIAVVLDMGVI